MCGSAGTVTKRDGVLDGVGIGAGLHDRRLRERRSLSGAKDGREPGRHPRAAEAPEALLLQLDSPGLDVGGVRLEELLVPAYGAIAAAAERRALGPP